MATDSLEVLRLFSALDTGSDLQRAYLTRLRCVLRFSQPLNAFIPPVSVTALFHAASTPGVFPFRGFPSLKCGTSYDTHSLPDVSSRFVSYGLQQAALPMPFHVRPPSRVYPFSESVHTVPIVKFITADGPLMGFRPSKGLPH
jgi:hypothetical protein